MGPYPYHSEQRGGKNRDNYEKDIKTQRDRQTDRPKKDGRIDRRTDGQTDIGRYGDVNLVPFFISIHSS